MKRPKKETISSIIGLAMDKGYYRGNFSSKGHLPSLAHFLFLDMEIVFPWQAADIHPA